MLDFKQFISEQSAPVEQGYIDDNGLPNVVIYRHRQGDMVDGVPNVIIGKSRKANVQEKVSSKSWFDVNDNSHVGQTDTEIEHKMKQSHPNTDETESGHLRKYSDDSSGLNTTLFTSHKFRKPLEDKICGHEVKSLDKAVSKYKLGHDLHVYSGVGFHPGHVSAKHPEGHIHLAAYTSTSTSKRTAQNFAEPDDEGESHVIHIHLKKGQKGRYMHGKSTYNEHESEYLLPRNTTLKVHPKSETHYDPKYGLTTHIWHAHVVKSEK